MAEESTNTSAPKGGGRDIWLDVLRFVAIAMVLGSHMDECTSDVHPWLRTFADTWRCGGWTGVDLFFVLSGFLVSGLIFSEYSRLGAVNTGRFLIRRGFKIYPAFWVVFAFTVAYRLRYYGNWLTPSKILSELFFVQNYVEGFWAPHWSLAVEEHFYLLLALGVSLTLKFAKPGDREPFRHLPWMFLAVAAFCLSVRWYNGTHYPFSLRLHLIPTHARIDSLFFGVLIAWALRKGLWSGESFTTAQRWQLLIAGSALFVPAFIFPFADVWWVLVFGVIAFYLGGGMLVMAGHGIRATWPLPFRLAAFIGEHSYSIYLWHTPYRFCINPRITKMLGIENIWWLRITFYMIGSIVVGIVMAKLIERPMLMVRDKWFPSRKSSLPTGVAVPHSSL